MRRVAPTWSRRSAQRSKVADVDRPGSVRALVERGDVLVTTVGPYLRFGEPALDAAMDGGAHYFDATGEGPFIRRVFDEYGARARRADCALLTAFGYDFVPGNLAGALALRDAADDARRATRVEIFYVTTGGGPSGGTMASGIGVMLRPGFAFRHGRLTGERQGARGRRLPVGRTQRRGHVDIGVRAFLAPPAPPRAPRCRRLPRRAGGTDLAAAGGVGSRRAGANDRAARTDGRAGVVGGGARLDRRPERERSPAAPAPACWLAPSTSRASASPRYASRGAIRTSSPRRSWRGGDTGRRR